MNKLDTTVLATCRIIPPMLGALITILYCLGAIGLGSVVLSRWTKDLDPALKIGLSGAVGLGVVGLITLSIGLIPGGLRWGLYLILLLGLVGLGLFCKEFLLNQAKSETDKKSTSQNPLKLLLIPTGIAMLFSLFGALGPSDTMDWDSLAYHLAVPKIWLEQGQITYIPYIHHSNFPFAIDNLYIWGLSWGGQSGAKTFSWFFTIFALLSIFGFARHKYGEKAAYWGTTAFATIPVVMWLSGTAYLDVSNGLFAGLGILFAAQYLDKPENKECLWLSAITLGFAAASKYTGLQTIFCVALIVFLARAFVQKQPTSGLKAAIAVGLIAMAIASPWYIKNALWTGNPVYPFFYEKIGSKNWDEFRAKIYKNEQQTFGIGRTESGRDLKQIGHGMFGLAYQPGRYINPGQEQGLGTPFGALGPVIIGTLLIWPLSTRLKRFEGSILAIIAVSFLLWFVLSQQSRYIISLAVPLSVMLGGAVVRLKVGPLIALLTVLQAGYSLYLLKPLADAKMLVVFGKLTPEQYLGGVPPNLPPSVGFYNPAQRINKVVRKDGKVALYDEVFGFFLDVPYFWANPGHSTVIPYETLENGEQYAGAMRELGFTHVYLNLPGGEASQRWLQATGLGTPRKPYEGKERENMMNNLELKWKVLLAEAVLDRELVVVENYRGSILFRITE